LQKKEKNFLKSRNGKEKSQKEEEIKLVTPFFPKILALGFLGVWDFSKNDYFKISLHF